MLADRAGAGMDRLVLRHEEGGKDGQGDVNDEEGGAEGGRQGPAHAGEQRDGTGGLADPPPARKPPPVVKIKLIHRHDQGLKQKWKNPKAAHAFLSRAPQTVRPGPKARAITRVPGAISFSSRISFKIWGTAEEEMFPRSNKTFRLCSSWNF